MTAFVKTVCGKFVRVDAVREFEYDDDLVTIHLEGGIVRQVHEENWRFAERGCGWHLCPAAPGTCVLHYGLDENGEIWVSREAVLGWALSARGNAYPITFVGVRRALDYSPVILHPDGSVQDIGGLFDSYDDWLKSTHHELIMHAAETGAQTAAIN